MGTVGQYSRKSTEAFVQWKDPPNSQRQGESIGALSWKRSGKTQQHAVSNSWASGKPPTPATSFSGRFPTGRTVPHNAREFPVQEVHSATSSVHAAHSGGGISRRSQEEIGIAEAPTIRRPPSSQLGGVWRGTACPSRSLSRNGGLPSCAENNSRNFEERSPESQSQYGRGIQQYSKSSTAEDGHLQDAEKMPTSWIGRSNNPVDGHRRIDPTETTDNEVNVCAELQEEYGEERIPCVDRPLQQRTEPFSFYNDNPNDNGSEYSDEEVEFPNEVEETSIEGGKDLTVFEDLMCADESTKRRERRQAQAAREREGDRRRKQGLPRNFLLVDEYTRKPYGVGVGDWRKELMLLSRNLDPAIGNINQQPHGAVAEIAEWIKHTWEYSAPVKFEYVKEVVARAVTLRRADLWKRIRNNEPKPEKLSDRSWRTLSRQLESPAIVRKSESCSRANASRINFGRTGPSGEVGVRERLRRKLRRSPEPEEIRFEMARDKGYGGRSKRRENNDNVLNGSEDATALTLQVADISGRSGMPHEEKIAEECPNDEDNVAHIEGPVQVEIGKGSIESVSAGRHFLGVSEEEMARHPFVKRMMERLQILEGQQSVAVIDKDGMQSKHVEVANSEPRIQVAGGGNTCNEVEGVAQVVEVEGGGVRRRPGRPKKKLKNT